MMITVHETQVTNRGKRFYLSLSLVESSLSSIPPQRVTKYGVNIQGKEYPVRQVIAKATGTPEIEWTTANAYRILQKLGFNILIH